MFIGHYAAALAAKRVAPKVSLGTFILASQFLDLLWPLLLLLGVEHVRIDPGNTPFTPLDFYDYPVSHSLLTNLLWSSLLGGIYFAVRRSGRSALVVALAVFSHWALDFVSHRPDLPLLPGAEVYAGLGLWYSPAATIIVESLLFAAGIFMYLRTTKAADRTGSIAFWGLAGFLAVIYILNILSPPPPDAGAVGIASLALWLLVPWGYWIDRHRSVVPRR